MNPQSPSQVDCCQVGNRAGALNVKSDLPISPDSVMCHTVEILGPLDRLIRANDWRITGEKGREEAIRSQCVLHNSTLLLKKKQTTSSPTPPMCGCKEIQKNTC